MSKLHHRAKLSDSQVQHMRADYKHGVIGYETLAARYDCGVSTARDICTYRTHRGVPDLPMKNVHHQEGKNACKGT